MTATEALERRIDELCRENEKLRKELEAEHVLAETLGHFHEQAQAENAKLRELVDYMTPIAWYGASERERDRMRELGIEVDG